MDYEGFGVRSLGCDVPTSGSGTSTYDLARGKEYWGCKPEPIVDGLEAFQALFAGEFVLCWFFVRESPVT